MGFQSVLRVSNSLFRCTLYAIFTINLMFTLLCILLTYKTKIGSYSHYPKHLNSPLLHNHLSGSHLFALLPFVYAYFKYIFYISESKGPRVLNRCCCCCFSVILIIITCPLAYLVIFSDGFISPCFYSGDCVRLTFNERKLRSSIGSQRI